MANDKDINIVIGEMTAKKSDLAVKLEKLPPIISKTVEEVLSKKFTVKKSTTGLKSGFLVSGNVMTLKQDEHQGQPVVFCAISISLDELPKGHLVPGKIEGSAKIGITKNLQGDAEFAAEKAANGAATTAIKQILAAAK